MGRMQTWLPCASFGTALASVLIGLSSAKAADIEYRDFSVQVDGKSAGTYHMTIARQDDGSVTMTAQTDVRVTVLAVPVYSYHYKGHEVWKAGKLQQFWASGYEKAKTFTVTATAADDGLHVNANGQAHIAAADVLLTSCWQLDKSRCNQPVVLLGCDTGSEVRTRLECLGVETVLLHGQSQPCTHCRVVNGTPHDLWYDDHGRLVRQAWQSGSHKSVIELVAIHN